MGNIFNNNLHNLKLAINYDEYWDFFLNKDIFSCYSFNPNELYNECLISYIDLTNKECIEDKWIVGLNKYTWDYAYASGYTLANIGYTGVDNGLIQFRKDRITNKDFIKIYSETDFSFIQNDFRLKLHPVSGNTLQYEYPYEILNDCIKLNGGFYQGIFKTDCDKYQILPSKINYGEYWDFEFVLNKTEFEKESNKTLNDKHQNNKGIFFYIGLRAENKWVFLYDEQKYDNKVNDEILDEIIEDDTHSLGKPNTFQNLDWYDDLEYWRIEDDIMTPNMNNYLDYVYYPDYLYQEREIDYLNDYVYLNSKPIIINDKSLEKDLEECCKEKSCSANIVNKQIVKRICCGCGKCKTYIIDEIEVANTKCEPCFHSMDDYIEGINDIFIDNEEEYIYVEDDIDISTFEFQTMKYGLSLQSSDRYTSIYSDNKFLLFHRSTEGFNVNNWIEDTIVEYRQVKNDFHGNLFLLMNRTCTSYTVGTIDLLRGTYNRKYNPYEDLYDNAFALRITDNGEIGYRLLSVDCDITEENKSIIYEGYSKPNIIKNNEWYTIHVRIEGGLNTMKLKFYINGKLKYITQDLPKINLRKLLEEDEKQEGVSFNISIGGGTQGLCDVILPNYMKNYEYIFPLEEHFGGSFIGYIKKFRWYNCFISYENILNNSRYENNNLCK